MKKLFIIPTTTAVLALVPKAVFAHCPLCTAGAIGAAFVAQWLGISVAVVGIFIGAASLSMGWWFANKIKRKFIPAQVPVVAIAFFLSVILPLIPIMRDYDAFMIGATTYMINLFIFGSVIGAFVVAIAPRASKAFSLARKGKTFPYQGLAITFFLLFSLSLIVEIVI